MGSARGRSREGRNGAAGTGNSMGRGLEGKQATASPRAERAFDQAGTQCVEGSGHSETRAPSETPSCITP